MGVSYSDIIERMRWSGKLKNDSAVARTLGVTPQALSNYKKRGEMPTDLVLRFAGIYGLSVDWLITGEGDMYRPGAVRTLKAGEEHSPYGREAGFQKLSDLAALSPEELIYVGKMLKILRGPNKSTASAIKFSVDAFLKAAEQPQEVQVKTAPEDAGSSSLDKTTA